MAKWDDVLDLTKHELQNPVFQKLAADPGSPVTGQFYYNTVTNKWRFYNGTAWVEPPTSTGGTGDVTQAANSGAAGRVKVSGAADKSIADYTGGAGLLKTSDANGTLATATVGTDYVTGASTNTFINKTFDANGTGNSISNIETADLAAGVLNTSTTLASATNAQVPSASAVKAYVDAVIGNNNAIVLIGAIDASTNPNYPAADAGHLYKISVAGLIGGASGVAVQANDTILCVTDGTVTGNQATVGTNWIITQTNLEAATTTVPGYTSYATLAEANAQSVSTKAVTPASLADYPIQQVFNIGDGTATSFVVTHNRNNLSPDVSVYDNSTNEKRYPAIVATSVNAVTISGYITAPTASQFRVVVMA